jgi:hypothetical protein
VHTESIEELEISKRYYEEELEKNHALWGALSSKRVSAQFCTGAGILLFVAWLLGNTDPFVGTLALIGAIVGAFWWWGLSRQMNGLSRRSLLLHQKLSSVEERYAPATAHGRP